jgi:hypothetical protein
MNGNDLIDMRDDRDCDNGYAWWYESVGQYEDEQKHAHERADAEAMLRIIAGEDEK